MEQQSDTAGRVIIVEDDADFRESIVKYLRNRGLDTTGAGSAIEFYREVSEAHYDLAILDLALPDQSGLILSQYLRANTRMCIVMLTAKTSLEERIAGYDAGADLYIVKPVDFRELYASLKNLLHRFKGGDEDVSTESTGLMHSWKLIKSSWSLLSPKGVLFRLTFKEYIFLNLLAEAKQEIVVRQAILGALGYENSEYGNRALESMIYRLRKKISPAFETPVKTASGNGYSFSNSIEIWDN